MIQSSKFEIYRYFKFYFIYKSSISFSISAYCKVTNLPFDENMLKWEPGPILDWDVWNGWHDSALKSSGFTKHDVQQLENFENLDDYPLEVQSCVKECQVYYEFLRSRKTEPTNT